MITKHNLNRLGIFSIFLLLLPVIALPLSFAEVKVDENMCKQMYIRYKEMGNQKFQEKYKDRQSIYNCIKLYKNSDWTFTGKSKIDKYYSNLELLSYNKMSKKADVKILYSIPTDSEKFLVKFKACADTTILKPSFLIQSKSEQYIGITDKILKKDTCNDYRTYVNAKYQSDIKIENILDLSKYKHVKSGNLKI
ncbi:MAG: hypothetical protein KGZ37_10565 [Nitrosarchaeum sp.]|nr:hypothetical protein [Nitrosarchaeum sp.]